MSQISIQNLTFAHYGASENLFDHTSLTLDTTWRLGFIGRNGRGKTTLLQLLMGRHEYSGRINDQIVFDYFPFDLGNLNQITGAVLLALTPEIEDWRREKELSLLAVNLETLARPLATLSGGERTKIMLAALFLRENSFPLIDEPTNHLDARGRELVADYLAQKPGFILVSHDRAFLDRSVDHILALNRTGFELQKGNYSTWKQNRDYQDQFEQAREDKLKRDIKQLGEAARRGADWSNQAERGKYGQGPVDRGFIGGKAARLMKRSKAVENRRQKALEERKTLLRDHESGENLKIETIRHPTGRVVYLDNVSLSYGSKTVFKDLTLTINPGDRILVTGPNGAGKSSLLKILAGELTPSSGQTHLAGGLTINYVPQDVAFLNGGLSTFIRRNNLAESRFKAILHKLGFNKRQFDTDLADFSGGQKKKVLLAAGLCRPAHLHIWDEPLNFIDLVSREQIESLILEHQPTLIMVEHDRMFAETVGTQVLALG